MGAKLQCAYGGVAKHTMASSETEHMLMKVPSIVCGLENWYRACTLLKTAGMPLCKEASLLRPNWSTADAAQRAGV